MRVRLDCRGSKISRKELVSSNAKAVRFGWSSRVDPIDVTEKQQPLQFSKSYLYWLLLLSPPTRWITNFVHGYGFSALPATIIHATSGEIVTGAGSAHAPLTYAPTMGRCGPCLPKPNPAGHHSNFQFYMNGSAQRYARSQTEKQPIAVPFPLTSYYLPSSYKKNRLYTSRCDVKSIDSLG
jgi:hypothetical protein